MSWRISFSSAQLTIFSVWFFVCLFFVCFFLVGPLSGFCFKIFDKYERIWFRRHALHLSYTDGGVLYSATKAFCNELLCWWQWWYLATNYDYHCDGRNKGWSDGHHHDITYIFSSSDIAIQVNKVIRGLTNSQLNYPTKHESSILQATLWTLMPMFSTVFGSIEL